MFLDWLEKLGFFTHAKDSKVFFPFPKVIRRGLAAQIVPHLLADVMFAQESFPTKQHLTVILEVLGQAFALDIEDAPLILQVADLYKRWFLSDSRPTPMKEDEDFFFLEMFKHMSMLFDPRDNAQTHTEGHARLCAVALDIFEAAGRDVGARFSPTLWENLLKTVMGICDHLLAPQESESALANILCPQLMKVLIALWVRSSTQSNAMWDKLKELMARWRHRMPFTLQWVATCSALTTTVLKLLYVYPENRPTVIFQSMGTSDLVQMDQGYVYYSWYRFLHILGDLEDFENPQIYLEVMKGVHSLVRQFYGGITIKNPKLTPPDGNSILHLFGPFLLDSVNRMRERFDEGKAEAFEAMLRLFSDKVDTDFDPVYLSSLYRGIAQGLNSGSNLLLDVIVSCGGSLLQSNINGVRCLVPAFWSAVNRILVTYPGGLPGGRSPPEELRRSCYKIISFLLGLPHMYGSLTFEKYFHPSFLFQFPPSTTFNDLLALRQLLLQSLLAENDDDNRVLLLSVLQVQLFEGATELQEFAIQFVKGVASVMTMHWGARVVNMALQCFADLSRLAHHLCEGNDALPHLMVNSLCDFIDILMRDKDNRSGMNEELIIRCFETITAWIMSSQWIVREQGLQPKDRTLLHKALLTSFAGVNGRCGVVPGVGLADGSSPAIFIPSDDVSHAAKHLLVQLTNNVDNFPTPIGPQCLNSIRTETEIRAIAGLGDSNNMATYILDNRIITLIRHPRHPTGVYTVSIIVRDATGKYTWTTQTQYNVPKEQDSVFEPPVDSTAGSLTKAPADAVDPSFLNDLFYFLGPDEKERHFKLQERMHARMSAETQSLQSLNYNLAVDVRAITTPLPVVDETWDNTALRLFLTNMGWMSIQATTRLYPVAVPDVTFLQELDKVPQRPVTGIAVLLARAGKMTESDLLAAESGTKEYQEFIEGLGWEIDLATHQGATGPLNPKATGSKTRYHASWDTECLFHIATDIPNATPINQQHKRALIASKKIVVVWCESLTELKEKNFNLIKEMAATFLIVVTPLNSLLHRISIIRKTDDWFYGPLVDDVVVSKHALPALVRRTSINLALREDGLWLHSQLARRQQMLDGYIKATKHDVFTHSIWAQAFS